MRKLGSAKLKKKESQIEIKQHINIIDTTSDFYIEIENNNNINYNKRDTTQKQTNCFKRKTH